MNIINKISSYLLYKNQFRKFRDQFDQFKSKSLLSKPRFPINWKDRLPCLRDNTSDISFDRHYIYHTAWAARVLSKTKPELHIDISSSLYFVAIVSAFLPVKHYDFRLPKLSASNLQVASADLNRLPFPDKSISSVSCMHVVEHIGLGRYGDSLDPEGDLKAISELKRILAEEGDLLFVIPIGKPKIMFNAHRIYSYSQIIDYFSEFKLIEFALIPDDPNDGGLISNASKGMADKQEYGCGCFHFRRMA